MSKKSKNTEDCSYYSRLNKLSLLLLALPISLDEIPVISDILELLPPWIVEWSGVILAVISIISLIYAIYIVRMVKGKYQD